MQTKDFDFHLPDHLIAQHPASQRNASRLLQVSAQKGHLIDSSFLDLPKALSKGDLLIFNDTRVIPARFQATKATGGAVEILLERLIELQGHNYLVELPKQERYTHRCLQLH